MSTDKDDAKQPEPIMVNRWREYLAKGGACWSPPALTAEQKKEQDEYIKKHNLPF